MEYRPLKLTLISADGIKDVKLFSKMDVYADVCLAGYPQSRKRTFVHKNCGTKPIWNFPMDFIVDEPYLTRPGLSLQINLMAQGTLTPDKLIGTVTVPVHDLFSSGAPDKILEYPVITASGNPKGLIKLSCRFGEKFTQSAEEKRRGDEPVTAYPAQPARYPPHPPPPAAYGGYPPQQAPGYGYGYQAPPPPGYGYGPQMPKKSGLGGMGMGLGAGLLGGLLVGEMASGIGDAAEYADGYGDAMDDMGDMGDFDF